MIKKFVVLQRQSHSIYTKEEAIRVAKAYSENTKKDYLVAEIVGRAFTTKAEYETVGSLEDLTAQELLNLPTSLQIWLPFSL